MIEHEREWDHARWPNFKPQEFACRCGCGGLLVDPELLDLLQDLRNRYGQPMTISSGYRCSEHNSRVSSTGPKGPHTTGKACDVLVNGSRAYNLLHYALERPHTFTGIGVNQKGDSGKRFIHFDILEQNEATRPWVWSY